MFTTFVDYVTFSTLRQLHGRAMGLEVAEILGQSGSNVAGLV